MDIPAGLIARPHVPEDAEAVAEIVMADEAHDIGEPMTDLDDIVTDWQRPGFDIARQSVGLWAGDTLAATAEVFQGRSAHVAVHPDRRGVGIGSWLAGWVEETARRDGGTVVGQSVPADSPAERLLRDRGYEERWTSWLLVLPPDRDIPDRPLPEGYAVRAFRPGEDEHAAYEVIEGAFGEWAGREGTSFEDWEATTVMRTSFDPQHFTLVVDPGGDVVGACLMQVTADDSGFVHQLAVRQDQRGRGLAQALLSGAFRQARALGARQCDLTTDSRTGALALYEKVGMEATHTWRNLGLTL